MDYQNGQYQYATHLGNQVNSNLQSAEGLITPTPQFNNQPQTILEQPPHVQLFHNYNAPQNQSNMMEQQPTFVQTQNHTPKKQNVSQEKKDYFMHIINNNRGKRVNVYVTYVNSGDWLDRVYHGIIEHAGKDCVIISDPSNNRNYLLKSDSINWIEMDEPISY